MRHRLALRIARIVQGIHTWTARRSRHNVLRVKKYLAGWAVGLMLAYSFTIAAAQPGPSSAQATTSATALTAVPTLPAPVSEGSAVAADIARLRDQLASAERRSADLEALNAARQNSTTLLLTIIGALIALVGLLFPIATYIATYFLSIRPANKATEDARAALQGLDSRFVELSQKYRDAQITRAIANLTNADPKVSGAAENEVVSDPFYTFSESQLGGLCEAIMSLDDGRLRHSLLSVIENHRSPQVLRTMVAVFNRSSEQGPRMIELRRIVKYSAVDDPKSGRALVEAVRQLSENEFISALPTIGRKAPSAVSLILNDDTIWHAFDVETWQKTTTTLHEVGCPGQLIDESAPAQVFKGRHYSFRDSSMRIVPAKDAVSIRVYEDGGFVETLTRNDPGFQTILARTQAYSSR